MQQSGGCDWIAGRTSWDTKLPLTHPTSLYFAQKPLLYKDWLATWPIQLFCRGHMG